MILNSIFPPDIRVEKEARTLIKEGHEVFIISKWREGMRFTEKFDDITIKRINTYVGNFKKYIYFGKRAINFIHVTWDHHIRSFISENDIDVIHVHDLPLAKTCYLIAKENNIPLIVDLHENYPKAVKEYYKNNSLFKQILNYLIIPPSRYTKLSKKILPNVDHIITVVEEAKSEYLLLYGVLERNITVIMNTEDLISFNEIEISDEVIEKYQKSYNISYIGGFGPHRGIDTAIQMMPDVVRIIPNAKLLLIGGKEPSNYVNSMKELCRELKIESNVEFINWIDFKLVPSFIATSSICLIPHHASGHTNSTVPHKLFQYMALKKPIITTDCIPLKRIVETTNSGIVIKSGDAKEMANAVIKLYQNQDLASQFGINGSKSVENQYNWEIESKKLIQIYEKIKKQIN